MEKEKRQDKIAEMKEISKRLRLASKAYYAEDAEIMSNLEYDRLYERLEALEAQTGLVLADSPTVTIGYEAVDELPKERHEKKMLSLDKIKEREELKAWLKGKEALLSWKLDGLTIVMTYFGGKLQKAVTRGDGEVGEVITNNARVFKNIPLRIRYEGELVLRGEAVITYTDFEKINEQIADAGAKYKNPRNLCSGSVRQLNNEITAGRGVKFFAFSLVRAAHMDFGNSREAQLQFLKEQGFDIVEYRRVDETSVLDAVSYYEEKVLTYDIPSDGLVMLYDDIAYGQSLGATEKFPRDAVAFKWADEQCETTLTEMEWSASRTGLINPIAVFEPVELEGTTVSRASVHNVSILRALKLGIGDKIMVYKANMIIPQIAENLTMSDTLAIPETCPACGGKTQIKQANGVQSLYCLNLSCSAKKINAFALFVSRDAMNVDGLSKATLEKLAARGFLREYADIFHLERHKEEIVQMEGFGEKSCRNLLESIEKARNTTLPKMIYSLGIANIGLANAKALCRHFKNNLSALMHATAQELAAVDGIGEVIAASFRDYFLDETNAALVNRLCLELHIADEQVPQAGEQPGGQPGGQENLSGKTFVITGSLSHFENRNALKEAIEARGGKVAGSVTGKTDCLVNNDAASSSSKNKKAKELGIAILTEEEFMETYLRA